MSIESARLFAHKMYTNREFANEVTKIEGDKDFNDFVVKTGYDFTAKELKEADHEIRKKASGELSEEELSMVVGGIGVWAMPCLDSSTQSYCKETQ